ncbi:MAG: hypothetical protein QG654_352, partial [Patescibacteria group bacterium]|nr:hypothetical protein [Patescibacteria group bacterium]
RPKYKYKNVDQSHTLILYLNIFKIFYKYGENKKPAEAGFLD